MASASTSSVEKNYMYDVFVSFRGKDLRLSFVDHLFEAFRRHGIIVFKDDKHIEVGEKISDELPKAIKDSKFHMVIFSERYADSYWCLNELVEILECQNPEKERTLYPIFYHVKPSEVREQKGPVGEAFAKHSENEAAGRWRDAMAKAASLEGWELTKTFDGHEVPFIQKIVHAISQKPYFAKFGVNDKLVGMATQVEKLLLSLQVGSDDVRMIGITGMGGVGKTTLAGVLFDRIANQFVGKSFVEKVRERSKDPRGLQDMQKQILTSVFGDQSIDVPSDFEGRSMMKRRMPSIKVVVVLDDVNDSKQLEALAESSWFRPGSRIIITSRDRQVLVAHGVESHNIHDVGTLSDEDAIRLLSRYAFKTVCPAQGYEELSEKVLRYAAGLPLTIKTLSSSLCGHSTVVWEDAINRLKKIPWGNTLEILKISYDALDKDQKDIFLHVSCLLIGQTKSRAIIMLESLGYHAKFGLGVLAQKSLITFRYFFKYSLFEYWNYVADAEYGYDDNDDDMWLLEVHDHIREMGTHIARSLHDEPQQCKLLWIRDEIEDIAEKDTGTEAIRGIKLLNSDLDPTTISQSLRKMSGLCFLDVYGGYRMFIDSDEAANYLPNSLLYLHWYRYPYRFLPKTFQGDNLVGIEMPYSIYIHQLWEGGDKKVPYLGYSEIEIFDSAGMTPNLEELVLRGCKKLVDVNISDECLHLKKLDLYDCKALEKLTISNECQNLDKLKLRECRSLRELQMHGECLSPLKSICLFNTKLCSLNLGMAPNLEVLALKYCEDLEELVMPVECRMLTKLFLTSTKLHSLKLGLTPNLKKLKVEYCKDFEQLNMLFKCPMLADLSISGINKLRCLDLGLSPNLAELQLEICEDFEQLDIPVELPMLTYLSISGIIYEDEFYGPFSYLLEKSKSLEVLCLKYDGMKRLSDDSLSMLKHHLRVLDLSDCSDLEQLPEDLDSLECLETLILQNCSSLRNIPDCICNMTRLKTLDLCFCFQLEKLPDEFRRLQSLELLEVTGIADRLKNLLESISQLKHLVVKK